MYNPSLAGAPPWNTYRQSWTAEASLFRTPLLSIYNALQAVEDCLSTSKYVKKRKHHR